MFEQSQIQEYKEVNIFSDLLVNTKSTLIQSCQIHWSTNIIFWDH